MHYIAYDPALFINGKRNVAESHTEDMKYPCRFYPCKEILKRLYEIFETSKKQDLTPPYHHMGHYYVGLTRRGQSLTFIHSCCISPKRVRGRNPSKKQKYLFQLVTGKKSKFL
jgi:hypothetical protein